MFSACADCFRAAARRDFSSGEEPLHGGAFQKIAPTPGKPISPEENIQNVWELRRSLRSPEETKHRPFDGGQRLEVASAPASGRCTEECTKKIAPAPDRLASPKKNIQNVWELRRSLRSPEEMTNGECFLLPSPLCIMEQRDCNHE